MKAYIKERTLQEANYVASSRGTIRQTAQVFNLSKSTVHNDLSKRLVRLDVKLFEQIKDILDENFSVKHLRGGEMTKRKYQKISERKSPDKIVEKNMWKNKNHQKMAKNHKKTIKKLIFCYFFYFFLIFLYFFNRFFIIFSTVFSQQKIFAKIFENSCQDLTIFFYFIIIYI